MTKIPGIGHNNPPPDPLPMRVDPAEAKAAAVLAGRLAADFSVQKAAIAAQTNFKQAEAASRQKREEIRKAVGALYSICVATIVYPTMAEELRAACSREGVPLRKTDVAIAVVRYHGKVTDAEKVNRYADVLREALLRKVPPSALTDYLSKPKQGIERLHKAYQRRMNKSALDHASIQSEEHQSMPKPSKNEKASKARHQQSVRLAWGSIKPEPYVQLEPEARLWVLLEKISDTMAEARRICEPREVRHAKMDARRAKRASRTRR